MREEIVKKALKLTLPLLILTSLLIAADGNRSIGYGMKSKGMGGVAVAFPQDSLINAINPAGMGFLESRYDIGPHYLKYRPGGDIRDNAIRENNQSFHADMDIPLLDVGYLKKLNSNFFTGVSFYQLGGSLNYGKSLHLLGTSKVLALYQHFILTPGLAWKILPNQSIGIGINLNLGRLKINGIENEKVVSLFPNHVTNNKSDYRPGIGVRIGWMAQLLPCLSAGISYTSKTWYHRYDKYKGFLPDKGNGDLPAQLVGGLAYQLNCNWVFAFDVHRIFWSKTKGFGNRFTTTRLLGSSRGSGLGWKDQTAYKLGIAYNYNENFTLRAGMSLATDVVPRNQTLSNTIVNLIAKDHITWGATWSNHCHEFTFAYIHAFRHTIKGKHSIPEVQGGGEVDLSSEEDWFGFSYGHTF